MSFQIDVPDDGSSRQASSSPYSVKAKIVVPDCGLGDMYDPFLDSFEPVSVLKLDCVEQHEPTANDDGDLYTVPKASISSNRSVNVEENNQGGVDKLAPSESDMTARLSVSSNKPSDVQEDITGNNDVGVVVSGDKDDEFCENDENGRECNNNSQETGTPNSLDENLKDDDNNVHEGDDDNTTTTRKKKSSRDKSKEKDSSSRSIKLFKVVLTKFVKDLLKPSWRQGNMSKEAFKTIVKRVVEKVSNSMEGRRIPKSRAKIDRYIDSSQHKLTKLVMGYVDKYVKA